MKAKRTHTCGELRSSHAGQSVTLNGWISSVRDHGGVLFLDLRDRYGSTQVTVNPGIHATAGDDFKPENVLAVCGTVRRRPDDAVNTRRSTGEIEVIATEVHLLNRTKPLPFEVTDESETREELRLKYRYLDMRRKPLTDAIVFRSRMCQIIREVFHGEQFIEVETPILMKTTPEGARDFIVPSRLHPGQVYALPQSPQLFKQTLMVCGMDRYFQICKCLRDEDLRADRQPEFTQLDMEMSFVEREDVFRVIEKSVVRLWKDLLGATLPAQFPRLTWQEAMDRYGIDKPDTRFGLELFDCSKIVANSASNIFRSAVASGGSVRGIHVPGGASLTRKQIDELEAVAKEYGAKGLAWMKLLPEGPQGPASKFLSATELSDICQQSGAQNGSLLVFVADKNVVVWAALARVRLALGRMLNLIDKSRTDCLWIIDFPLFEFNEDTKTWQAMHHMFTSPIGELPADASDLGSVIGNLYDLVINGNELGSGSIRIHRPEVQQKVFDLVGISRAEAETKFGWFLRALDYGAPPHGGIALGVDRLVMVMLGAESLRDVIAFPKNSSGICPLTESPSEPVGDALGELGLMLKPQSK